MRRMSRKPIATFSLVTLLLSILGAGIAGLLAFGLPLGHFDAIVFLALWILVLHVLVILAFRSFFGLNPLPEGEGVHESRAQFASDIYVLSNLIFFHPLLRNPLIPIPLMRLILQALGARLGVNSYSAGLIQDPCLTELGNNTLVGESALVLAHAIEGSTLCYRRVRIGSHVTIGARSIVMPGTVIEDGAIIAAGAVIAKGARVGRNEVWGGVPARKIKVMPGLTPATEMAETRGDGRRIHEPDVPAPHYVPIASCRGAETDLHGPLSW